VAAILSVVEFCRGFGASVKEYLGDVLPGMDGREMAEVVRSRLPSCAKTAADYQGFVLRLLSDSGHDEAHAFLIRQPGKHFNRGLLPDRLPGLRIGLAVQVHHQWPVVDI
jgi:hypothetical protein